MKKITFIVQSKGGVGKSAFTYMLANINQNAESTIFVDMDNETNTSQNQLKFVKVISHKLIDQKTKNIDRAAFDTFFEDFIISDKVKSAICDMGASSSEQFLVFLRDDSGAEMLQELKEHGVTIQVCCVVAGSNAFPSSAEYARELVKAIGERDNISKIIVKNNYFSFSDEQEKALSKLSQISKTILIDFNIVPNNVPGTVREIHSLMEEGMPIENAKTLTKLRLKPSLSAIKVAI